MGKFLNINSFFVCFTEKGSGRAFHVSKSATKTGKLQAVITDIKHFLLEEGWILQLEKWYKVILVLSYSILQQFWPKYSLYGSLFITNYIHIHTICFYYEMLYGGLYLDWFFETPKQKKTYKSLEFVCHKETVLLEDPRIWRLCFGLIRLRIKS